MRRRDLLMMPAGGLLGMTAASATSRADGYRVQRHVATKLFTPERCWVHPRAGIVPQAGRAGNPRVVMTMNSWARDGDDVFRALYSLHTNDLGRTWTQPEPAAALAPHYEMIDGQRRPVAVSDFWPTWHAKTNTLLGTGHTVAYTPDWRVTLPRPRHTSYSVYDPATDAWSAWKKMSMGDDPRYADCGAGCTQRYDLPDGRILLPIYFRPPSHNSRVAVALCDFDGQTLRFREHGNELFVDDDTRGLHEPSLTKFNGQYLLTIRNDKLGFVTRSSDGLQYEALRPWQFDTGDPLGSYNTQQHWVRRDDALYLVYTRRGANNDHVFRHRAPLFMARVDPERLVVLRSTEQILVPERGARLGNFGITEVTPRETWVTVAELMEPEGVEKYGSDGSVFVAQLQW